jgi:hypothetical protein
MASERRLVAIVFTDIVGDAALMAESEEKGYARASGTGRSCNRGCSAITATDQPGVTFSSGT